MSFHIKSHLPWIFGCCAALALYGTSQILLPPIAAQLTATQAAQTATERRTSQTLAQLRSDAANVAALTRTISAEEADALLRPTDRLAVATLLEQQAALHQIQAFTFALSPEKKADTPLDDPSLVTVTLTLEGEGPDDASFIQFLKSVEQSLPGRAQLVDLNLTRPSPTLDLGTLKNVKASARFTWLANSSQTEAP